MSLPFRAPPDPAWTPAPSEPPDVSATPQARLIGWERRVRGDAVETTGCFGFTLEGWIDELTPVAFERLEAFTVRAAGGREGPLVRAPSGPRRESLRFSHEGVAVRAEQALGFDDGELVACFVVCAPQGACEARVDTYAWVGAGDPPPPASVTLRVAQGLLAHPSAALTVLGACVAALVAWLLFGRRVRFR